MSSENAKMPEELERKAFFEKTAKLQKRLEKSITDCKTITQQTKDYIDQPTPENRIKMQNTSRFRCQRP